MSGITIEVDQSVDAAYITLSDQPVVRTVQHNEAVLIDLDQFGCAVGIEFLDQSTLIPFQELVDDYHVHSDVVELLRLVRPDVASFIDVTRGNDGSTVGSPTSSAWSSVNA